MTSMDDTQRHLVIAGVPKAGTTSLFEYLAQHPRVHPSRVRQTAFFKEAGGDVGDYLGQFRGARPDAWLLESTPGYLARGRAVAERIDRTLPGVHVVVSLRNPVDRFVSHHRMRVRGGAYGDAPPSLASVVAAAEEGPHAGPASRALAVGRYVEQLPDWHDVLGSRLHVVFFDDLVRDPRLMLRDLCRMIGLPTDPVDTFDLTVRNRGGVRRHPALARLARVASHAMRPVFQRHPRTRGALVSWHDALNHARPEAVEADDADARARLAAHYEPSVVALAVWLTDCGYTQLPSWVGTAHRRLDSSAP